MKNSIVTIIPSLYDGGAEKFVADISHHLSKKYDHTILLYNRKPNKYEYSGAIIELTVPQKNYFFDRIRRQLIILKKIKRIKKELRPKLTISHMLLANMLNILTRKHNKTICVLHGEWSVKSGYAKLWDRLVKKYYARADMIVSVSHYIKNTFNDYYELDVPHKVIYIGVDLPNIREKASEEIAVALPDNYIVYVAGFREVKNHVQLIKQLAAYLKKTDISLVLVGDGPLRANIEAAIIENQLEEKIIVLGSQLNPYPIVKKAKLSLMVSSSESFSLAVLESMVLGTPMIATDCGGPREILVEDWNKKIELPFESDYGILIDKPENWNENSLVSEIDKITNNEALAESISQKAKRRAERFSLHNSEKEYELLINNLLEE